MSVRSGKEHGFPAEIVTVFVLQRWEVGMRNKLAQVTDLLSSLSSELQDCAVEPCHNRHCWNEIPTTKKYFRFPICRTHELTHKIVNDLQQGFFVKDGLFISELKLP